MGEERTLRTTEEAKDLTLKVLSAFVTEGDAERLLELRQVSTISPQDFSGTTARIVEQRRTMASRFGEHVGLVLVKEGVVEESLYKIEILEKMESAPTRWRFLFYRATDEWKLLAFFWDDRVADLFSDGPT